MFKDRFKLYAIVFIFLSVISAAMQITARWIIHFPESYNYLFYSAGLILEVIIFALSLILLIVSIAYDKSKELILMIIISLSLSGLSLFFISPITIPAESGVRSFHSQVRSEHRSLSMALEVYFVDNNKYPESASGENGINRKLNKKRGGYKIPTFKNNVLTTPLAYCYSINKDPFSEGRTAYYGYYSTGKGYILVSWGPDRDENKPDRWDLMQDIENVYSPDIAQPSLTLLLGGSSAKKGGAYTYEPTNGTVSEGDIWRIRQ